MFGRSLSSACKRSRSWLDMIVRSPLRPWLCVLGFGSFKAFGVEDFGCRECRERDVSEFVPYEPGTFVPESHARGAHMSNERDRIGRPHTECVGEHRCVCSIFRFLRLHGLFR